MSANNYKDMTAKEMVNLDNQGHLKTKEKNLLEVFLGGFEDLFLGKVGNHKGMDVEFELEEGTKPFYARPYNIPVSLLDSTKEAIQEMIQNGVLKQIHEDTEWAAPTFCVPKKTTGVRVISDF